MIIGLSFTKITLSVWESQTESHEYDSMSKSWVKDHRADYSVQGSGVYLTKRPLAFL